MFKYKLLYIHQGAKMNKLCIKLKNCYGIKELKETEFSFEKSNVNVIYAKNGLMKTSLAKVFKKFQDGKEREIKDEIFGNGPVITEIKVDDNDIQKEEIFVIKPFESFYESANVASLLINNELNTQLEEVLGLRNTFLKILETKSGLKISKVSQGKTIFELEPKMLDDFHFEEKSFLQNMDNFEITSIDYNFENIKYLDIFNGSVIKKIESDGFQSKIQDFLVKSDKIYAEYNFLDKGNFTLPKLEEVEKRLEINSFFVKLNEIVLDGNDEPLDLTDLKAKIGEIKAQLQDTAEFREIEKLLSDVKGRDLIEIIEKNPEIIEELTLVNLDEFRKKLWRSYIKYEEDNFNILKTRYSLLKEQIEDLNIDETLWREAIDIFNDRFTLPFKMDIDNLTSSIIGESPPKVIFKFCDKKNVDDCGDDDWITLDRDELEKSDTLSQGEKRALYLLNIIFDIEKIRKENQKTLFIIDDIADSFDYKNKYAIIEYLEDISKIDNCYMIILTHNFDFYRTISSRLDMDRKNKFHAINSGSEIQIEEEHYQKQPFNYWKENLDKKHITALIPFVRNLIDYGVDKKINDFSGIEEDSLFLTNLLHLKDNTKNITFGQLKKVYKEYIGNDDFDSTINDLDKVYDLIIDLADNQIADNDLNLENKIIFAISIRLKAEEFMKREILNSSEMFTWKNKRIETNGNNEEFLYFVENGKNQTRELFKGFIQIRNDDGVKVLGSVNIMTPENIHLNSFMYEPILDMDIVELKNLYGKVKNLFNN